MPPLDIREIEAGEFELVWPIFHAVVSAGDTYAYDPEMTLEEARVLWTRPPARCFAARQDGVVVGAYCLRPNQTGLGDHVANAGYWWRRRRAAAGSPAPCACTRSTRRGMLDSRPCSSTSWPPATKARCASGSGTGSRSWGASPRVPAPPPGADGRAGHASAALTKSVLTPSTPSRGAAAGRHPAGPRTRSPSAASPAWDAARSAR